MHPSTNKPLALHCRVIIFYRLYITVWFLLSCLKHISGLMLKSNRILKFYFCFNEIYYNQFIYLFLRHNVLDMINFFRIILSSWMKILHFLQIILDNKYIKLLLLKKIVSLKFKGLIYLFFFSTPVEPTLVLILWI